MSIPVCFGSAVTFHPGGLSIDTTLNGERYLAWWRRSADLYTDVTYTITFADGTVHEDVRQAVVID